MAALESKSAFYIMTSAKDILFDVFKQAMDSGKFVSGVFILCRYSFKPFFTGMYASGIKGAMFPFCEGDCRDYGTWSRADRGEKAERTEVSAGTRATIESLFRAGADASDPAPEIKKEGNIFYASG